MAEAVSIAVYPPLALASLIARRGCAERLREAVRTGWNVELPKTPRVTKTSGICFVWAGPERWLAASASMRGEALVAALREVAGDIASFCDQSDSRMLLAVSGHRAREVLAKCIQIDLHLSAFETGDTAISLFGHVGCQIWQTDERPTYVLAVPRSYGASVRAWLEEASGEFTNG